MSIGSLPGMAQPSLNMSDAKELVIELLKEYGRQSYSRLLMTTRLPEPILHKVVDSLIDEDLINRDGEEEDPIYELVPRRWFRAILG